MSIWWLLSYISKRALFNSKYKNMSKDRASRSLPRSIEPFFLVSPQEQLHFVLSLSIAIHILCMGWKGDSVGLEYFIKTCFKYFNSISNIL